MCLAFAPLASPWPVLDASHRTAHAPQFWHLLSTTEKCCLLPVYCQSVIRSRRLRGTKGELVVDQRSDPAQPSLQFRVFVVHNGGPIVFCSECNLKSLSTDGVRIFSALPPPHGAPNSRRSIDRPTPQRRRTEDIHLSSIRPVQDGKQAQSFGPRGTEEQAPARLI